MARLGDVFERQITGEWGSECLENETGTNILRTTNFTSDGIINYNNVVVRSIENTKVQSKRLHYGDIILEKSGGTDKTPVGRVVFCDPYIETGTYLCNNFTQAMRVNSSMAVPKYVFYFMWNLHWSGKTELMQNKTTGIRNLQVKSYLNQSFPLPSLDEQRRIAATLDKVTGLISKRRQQLDKLDELVKARFVEQFNHYTQFKKLEELATLITKGSSPKWQGINYTDSGTLFVTSENVQIGFLDLKKRKYLDNRINEIQPRSILHRNDVLVNIVGASIGRAAIFDCDELANINQAVALVRIDVKRTNLKFLITYLNSPAAMDIYTKMKKGGARDNLSLRNIADLPIPVVPLEAQDQFASFLDQTETVKVTINRSLEKLETLKKALMQEYFK